jgi:hypothetical protein
MPLPLLLLPATSGAACLQESDEKPAAIERQTIIDMRGPQVCVLSVCAEQQEQASVTATKQRTHCNISGP